jgi:Domain of unknown function (DUF4412)
MRFYALPLALLVLAATTSCKKSEEQSGDGGTEGGTGAASAGGTGASLAFLSGFEGEVDAFMKDSSKPNPQPVPLAVLIKSGKVKLEIPEALIKHAAGNPLGDKGYVIFDSAAKKLTAVSDPKKMAIVIDLNNSGKTLSGMTPPGTGGHGAPSGPPPKITKTGKTDTVAGYSCEYWDITSDHKEGTVCMGSDGPSWFSIPMTGIPTEHAWMLDLMDGKHFPLRFIGYAKDGTTEENRVEVTKIDKKSLPDSEFQVPAGYKTIDLEKMFQGMPGMPAGMPPGMPPGMPGMPGGGGFPMPPPHH